MTSSPRVRAWARQQHRLQVLETCLARSVLLLPALFVLSVLLVATGLLAREQAVWVATLAWLPGVAVCGLLVPIRFEPQREDAELGAGDALATCLAGAAGPAAELVTRDVELLLPRAAAAQDRKRRDLVLLIALVAGLVLLAAWLLPGHAPVPGSGIAAGGGGGTQQGPGPGPGDAQNTAGGEAGATKHERREPGSRNDERPKSDQPERRGEEPPPDRPTGGAPARRHKDLVVFPDFRGGDRTSERRAPKIDRAPQARSGAPERRTGATGAKRADPKDLREEWQRQRERALARGSLDPWEGDWLHRYGRCLDAGGAKRERRGAGK